MITETEQLTIEIKYNGNVEISKLPIFVNEEGKQVGVGDRWRIAIAKDDATKLIEVLGADKANAIINEHWA